MADDDNGGTDAGNEDEIDAAKKKPEGDGAEDGEKKPDPAGD